MKLANVREMRNNYKQLLSIVASGEEVLIESRGKPVAKMIPPGKTKAGNVNWSQSSALLRDKSSWKKLGLKETSQLLDLLRKER